MEIVCVVCVYFCVFMVYCYYFRTQLGISWLRLEGVFFIFLPERRLWFRQGILCEFGAFFFNVYFWGHKNN